MVQRNAAYPLAVLKNSHKVRDGHLRAFHYLLESIVIIDDLTSGARKIVQDAVILKKNVSPPKDEIVQDAVILKKNATVLQKLLSTKELTPYLMTSLIHGFHHRIIDRRVGQVACALYGGMWSEVMIIQD